MLQRFRLTINRVRPGLLFGLLLAIFCVYLSTYSARIETGDTLRIFDAASSVARFGDTLRDESLWQEPPLYFSPYEAYSLNPYEPGEDLIVYFVALFYAAADLLPGIGLVHATWLFNVVVSTAAAEIWYLLSRSRGYDHRSSAAGMLLLAFATILWVYSKSLFREPFVSLFLLLTFYFLVRWRGSGYRQVIWLAAALMAAVINYGARNSTVLALPALVLFCLPVPRWKWLRTAADGVLAGGFVVGCVLVWLPGGLDWVSALIQPRYPGMDFSFMQVALQSYLFSPGGSMWGTSPVLLLALPGAIWLIRSGQRRIVWFVVLLLLGYAVGHAALTEQHWFGGLSWTPRFLVPVVPFVLLLALPIIEAVVTGKRRWLGLAALVVTAYSVGIQVIAVISFHDAYVGLLPEEANGLLEWLPGLMEPRYFRWVLLPQTWGSLGFDIAWIQSGAAAFIVILLCVGMVAATAAVFNRRWTPVLLAGSGVLVLLVLWTGLRWLYDHDTRYWSDKSALFALLDVLDAETETSGADPQPLLLADTTYDRFIMNYNRIESVRPLVAGIQPGEAVSDRMPARITSDYPPELLSDDLPPLIDHLANQHERIWLLAHNSIFLPWSIRPIERYLAAEYYPYREIVTDDPTARLLAFHTAQAPSRYDFRLPEITTDLRFGAGIQLAGVTLPSGLVYTSGDIVPVTFYWTAAQDVAEDYVVAWFIARQDGGIAPIQGIDSVPDWGFAPTAGWKAGQQTLDNRAIELPAELSAGAYRIWTVLYGRTSGERLPVSGAETLDGTIGVLPITLTLHAQR